ncbi:MAG: phosphoenolpyruvate carboxykinase (GTP) [Christensenellaceae bacterium]|nr:phosphoenolpyruvate carboxykinase (GTP) [Clostridia bacterium]PWL99451.1 MAG: phosphoenolpyruvate carboxykinase (GTP) [Clostridiales bacterium]
MTNNKKVLKFVEDSAAFAQPDKIVWIDGSEAQRDALRAEAVASGEILKLNEELLPDCYLHRTAENDVARVEDRTFICSRKEEDAMPHSIVKWMAPDKAYKMVEEIARGKMKGRTMYVIPYSMGVIGSPFSKIGIEVTDSIYVVLNMEIMTRVGTACLEQLGENGDFVKGFHCKCDVDPEKRYIMHFPEDNTIVSVNSAYGGNVLLGKKCFALRIATHLGKEEGWMAEHMLILGCKRPQDKEIKYIAAAFPSACGKTNLAMLIPPQEYLDAGYEIQTVGDDIAWIRVGEDGRLWAANPENGFFGVAPGTNEHSNPNALAATKKGTIFTNVAYDPETNTVWWEKLTKEAPKRLIDWKGNEWTPETNADGKHPAAHPNSRFTAPAVNCPCISPEFDSKKGVPLSAIIFGGRRATTTPLVYQSRDWNHGTFVGTIMSSETTAAATGAVGVLRHDPMAMKPFMGYSVDQYFQHWIDMGAKVPAEKQPKIFNVNWFRQDENGDFMWPGFGDNMRVLDWILDRCEGKVEAQETAIGYVPYAKDINIKGADVTPETLDKLLYVDKARWGAEAEEIEKYYDDNFGDKLPKEIRENLEVLKENCAK